MTPPPPQHTTHLFAIYVGTVKPLFVPPLFRGRPSASLRTVCLFLSAIAGLIRVQPLMKHGNESIRSRISPTCTMDS
jgi:hypothetical protein